MRLTLLLCLLMGSLSAQTKFKNIQFGGATDQVPVSLNKLNRPEYQDYSSQLPVVPNQLRALQNVPFVNGANPLSDADPFSFWATALSPMGLNLRAANNSVQTFIAQFKSEMKIKDPSSEFKLIKTSQDDLGMTHIRIQQTYHGLPVYGGEMIIHGPGATMKTINGKVFPTPSLLNTTADLNADQAGQIAMNDLTLLGKWGNLSASFIKAMHHDRIQSDLQVYIDNDQKAHLAYIVHAMGSAKEVWKYFVDAHDGNIIKKYRVSCTFLPESEHGFLPTKATDATTKNINKIADHRAMMFDGKTTTNSTDLAGKAQVLNTYLDQGTFYLVDASRKMFVTVGATNENPVGVIQTFDGKNKTPNSNNFTINYITTSSNNSSWVSPVAASAHVNAGTAYQYYLTTHGRNSINGKGGNIDSYVNVVEDDGTAMDNAFWNGEAMFYGNGNVAFSPLARALDVAGHELSHGVIQETANLDYDTESGALNESFADIFGRLIERQNWTVGEEVVKLKYFPTGALRSFIDPHNGGNQLSDAGYQPRIYSERYIGTEDNGGVHINSGINNWAFYKFTTAINNDLSKAEKVYYRALDQYLTRSSRFIDCRKAVIQAATDLFGASSAEVTAAKAAYDAVGISDGTSTQTQKNTGSNPGSDFVVYIDATTSKLVLTDGTGRVLANPLSSFSAKSKPSVTDDGVDILFVGTDKKIHYVEIDWASSKITADQALSQDTTWRNVVISPDGNRIAALKDKQEPAIWIYDFNINKGEWKSYPLYNPTTSTSNNKTGDVQYADAMDFDITGNTLMYDSYNKYKTSKGTDADYWDISFIKVHDGETGGWGNGKIGKLYGQLPENTSIGNPVYANNSPYIIAFDYVEGLNSQDPKFLLLGGNIETSAVDSIFGNSDLSFPSYSRLDDKVIFNASTQSNTQVLAVTNVTASKITASGNASVFVSKARLGTWFSNGSRKLSTPLKTDAIHKIGLKISPNPVSSNQMQLQWSQPAGIDKAIFSIYNLAGTQILTMNKNYVAGNQSDAIPVHQLSQGMYILKVNIGNSMGAVKFVKE